MPPAHHEPEDILSDVPSESLEPSHPAPVASGVAEVSGQDGKLKTIMIVLMVVAGVLVLGVGGLFVYRTYFMKTEPEKFPEGAVPAINTSPEIPSGAQTVPTTPSAQPENPPVVEPTPEPNIPKPATVGSTTTGAMMDTDGDGLSDAREGELRTDPLNTDTDGDKLNDGEEVSIGTDPLVADTDGDGLPDGDEVRVWKTDPKNRDTDGDSYADGDEVKNGYNPLGNGKLSDVR